MRRLTILWSGQSVLSQRAHPSVWQQHPGYGQIHWAIWVRNIHLKWVGVFPTWAALPLFLKNHSDGWESGQTNSFCFHELLAVPMEIKADCKSMCNLIQVCWRKDLPWPRICFSKPLFGLPLWLASVLPLGKDPPLSIHALVQTDNKYYWFLSDQNSSALVNLLFFHS